MDRLNCGTAVVVDDCVGVAIHFSSGSVGAMMASKHALVGAINKFFIEVACSWPAMYQQPQLEIDDPCGRASHDPPWVFWH